MFVLKFVTIVTFIFISSVLVLVDTIESFDLETSMRKKLQVNVRTQNYFAIIFLFSTIFPQLPDVTAIFFNLRKSVHRFTLRIPL
jgi:hypothetical protein